MSHTSQTTALYYILKLKSSVKVGSLRVSQLQIHHHHHPRGRDAQIPSLIPVPWEPAFH